jgi:hypothetical protein
MSNRPSRANFRGKCENHEFHTFLSEIVALRPRFAPAAEAAGAAHGDLSCNMTSSNQFR